MAAVQKTKDLLIRNRTRLLGIVVNKFDQRDAAGGYGYGYGYGYPSAGTGGASIDPRRLLRRRATEDAGNGPTSPTNGFTNGRRKG